MQFFIVTIIAVLIITAVILIFVMPSPEEVKKTKQKAKEMVETVHDIAFEFFAEDLRAMPTTETLNTIYSGRRDSIVKNRLLIKQSVRALNLYTDSEIDMVLDNMVKMYDNCTLDI